MSISERGAVATRREPGLPTRNSDCHDGVPPLGPGDGPGVRAGSRHETIRVVLLVAAVTCLFFNEIVFFGKTILPLTPPHTVMPTGPYGFSGTVRRDQYRRDPGASSWLIEPQTRKVGRELLSGQLPLWNEHKGFGSPLLGSAQAGAFDILHLPMFISDSTVAWDLYVVLRSILGGLAMYAFSRTVGLVPAGAFAASAGYVFSGHFFMFSNMPHQESYFSLPLLLLGIEHVVRGRRFGAAICATAIAIAMLAGHPEASLMAVLFGAAYGGYRLLWLMAEVGRREWVARATRLGLAGLAGVALAAPLVFTVYEYMGQAFHIRVGDRVLGLSAMQADDLVLWAIPYLKGPPLAPAAPARPGWHAFAHAGAAILVLALYALYPAKTRLHRHVALFMAVGSAVLISKIFGAPLVNAIGRAPGLELVYFPMFGPPLVSLSLAFLAGYGVHRLSTEPVRPRWATVVALAFLGFVLLGVAANWTSVAGASMRHLAATAGLALIFAGATCSVLVTRHRLGSTVAGTVCGTLVVLELFILAPHGIYQDRHERWTEPQFVRYLRERQADGPFRLFALGGILFPNLATPFGLDDIREYDALRIDRYVRYIDDFIARNLTSVEASSSVLFTGVPGMLNEGPTRTRHNPWFDLAGVRYVVVPSSAQVASPGDSLIDELVAANLGPAYPAALRRDVFSIDGVTRPVLFAHPPAALRYPMTITADRTLLRFSPVLHPNVWDPSKGNGVGFEVYVEANGTRQVVYRRDMDPKNEPADRSWHDETVDLFPFVGRRVVLVLETDPLGDPSFDWAAWGNLQLTPASPGEDQYTLVYDGEVQVFENRKAFPRAFLLGDVRSVADVHEARVAMKQADLDPSKTAIVENAPPEDIGLLDGGGGTASVLERNASTVIVEVDARGPSFLVLTDSYYPGWVATVDGREVEIYPTDLAFRGIFVPGGRHQVVFSYRPASFSLGVMVALVGVIMLVALCVAGPRRAVSGPAGAQSA